MQYFVVCTTYLYVLLFFHTFPYLTNSIHHSHSSRFAIHDFLLTAVNQLLQIFRKSDSVTGHDDEAWMLTPFPHPFNVLLDSLKIDRKSILFSKRGNKENIHFSLSTIEIRSPYYPKKKRRRNYLLYCIMYGPYAVTPLHSVLRARFYYFHPVPNLECCNYQPPHSSEFFITLTYI